MNTGRFKFKQVLSFSCLLSTEDSLITILKPILRLVNIHIKIFLMCNLPSGKNYCVRLVELL